MPKPKKNEDPFTNETTKKTTKPGDDKYFLMNDFKSFLSESGIDAKVENDTVIPTGIDLLDTILGGGIRMHFSMFVGTPGGGKSALALQVVKSGQSIWGDKFLTFYIDTEESVDEDRLTSLGIDPSLVIIPEA